MSVRDNASATVVGGLMANNSAPVGAAIGVFDNSSTTLQQMALINNTAQGGAGLYATDSAQVRCFNTTSRVTLSSASCTNKDFVTCLHVISCALHIYDRPVLSGSQTKAPRGSLVRCAVPEPQMWWPLYATTPTLNAEHNRLLHCPFTHAPCMPPNHWEHNINFN
jgi:hypothetical protein